MKVFEDQTKGLGVGQEANNFRIDNTLFLSDLRGGIVQMGRRNGL